MQDVEQTYQVKLDSFTGPLDLLLHLIKKNEINIYDIPIALITRQYLEYISFLKDLNLSFAGEFLVMATTLIQIKSRLLLPKEEDSSPLEEQDTRSELVRLLVEYQQFKDVAGRLSEQERMWRDFYQREPLQGTKGPVQDVLLEDVGLFDLLDVLQDVLSRTESQAIFEITPETLTVQDRINAILEWLEIDSNMMFSALFEGDVTKGMIIVTFMAVLELVRMKLVLIYQADLFGPIRITRAFLAGSGSEVHAFGAPHNGSGNDNSANNGGVHGRESS